MADSDYSSEPANSDEEIVEEKKFHRLRQNKKGSAKPAKRQFKVVGASEGAKKERMSKEAKNTAAVANLLKRKGSAVIDLSVAGQTASGGNTSKRPRSSNAEPIKRREFTVTGGRNNAAGSSKISKRPGVVKTSRAGGPRMYLEDSLQFFHRKLLEWDLGLKPVTAEANVRS
jgi:hypothetical protein